MTRGGSNPRSKSPRPFSREAMPCVCGGQRRETQAFCFQCWEKLPGKTRYDMCDGDGAKRAFARADAQHFLEHLHGTGVPLIVQDPELFDKIDRDQIDRKTASTGEHS